MPENQVDDKVFKSVRRMAASQCTKRTTMEDAIALHNSFIKTEYQNLRLSFADHEHRLFVTTLVDAYKRANNFDDVDTSVARQIELAKKIPHAATNSGLFEGRLAMIEFLKGKFVEAVRVLSKRPALAAEPLSLSVA